MGHLINIANNIVNQCEKNNILASFLKNNLSPECLTKWESLVSVQLVEINKIHQSVMMVCDSDIFLTFYLFFFLPANISLPVDLGIMGNFNIHANRNDLR